MKSPEPASATARNHSPADGRAEAAALATKVAALAERGETQRTPAIHGRPHHGFVWWAVYCIAWLATLSLLAIATLRVFYHDGAYLLTWLNAFTRYVYLPAWVCLLWAVWQRRWFLGSAAAVVASFHLLWLAPNVLPDRRFFAPPSAESRTVRIFFANVNMDNREHRSLLEEIAEADPDVVVLVEVNHRWYRDLYRSSIATAYPYGDSGRPYASTTHVISKLPLTRDTQERIKHRDVRSVDFDLGSQKLRLIGLHAPRPMNLPHYDYYGFWEQVMPMLTADQGPLVIVGDFNATEHSRVYKQLRDAGLRSAHDDRGRGYATTWPTGKVRVPPIRIDQAFLSPQVECDAIIEGRGLGSDHKPLLLDVRVRR